ncbi:type IV pilin protein [Ramlibacter ginsenosidimutans]|uniref:Type IV pilin protein n=1 Tax=Ramlibacter ginsenosidimutans TaxID=502333 RepID=A0A934WM42_9BURK|nr:type IV pilin protein [Ramlibacter ginsenosidimutans]MBK6006093.1 type IV pilin protein [Ramlibacter ginsenosidimutans]
MNRVRGFSLIELMVVVAVIGLLASIALPSYTRYVLRSHRSSAITGVLDVASRQARYYTTNNTYTTSMTALGYPVDPMPLTDSSNRYYDLSVASASATAFTVRAVPVNAQTKDTCGTYTYTDLGVKSITSGTLGDCWKQ